MSRVKYSDENNEQVVREVVDIERSIASVASSYDMVPQTVGNWVMKYKKEHGSAKERQAAAEAVEVARLKKQVRELQQENEFLKSGGLLRGGTAVSKKYELFNREEGSYPISSMCRWARVSRSGYYSWRDRPQSRRDIRRQELEDLNRAELHF